ncbi:bile acid:sodium symporter family protein [Zhihengliuella flava]|uniref:BASS family bile acid:Na+ symporter n=1 Tax=Zhihengliuella flava TaxID=1285193 RepID=A0A931DAW8_9MICC|nr:bile acid:sodium symporter family protein [Zhihengliuella flava]MBG6084041.1 BASS family bile acid:Na+ symporter [Zhihengliuella flava]
MPDAPNSRDAGARLAVTVFPLLILAGGAVAFLAPTPFAEGAFLINPLLMVIMFGMGLTLSFPDFALLARHPGPVLIGVGAQYGLMPVLGWAVASILGLDPVLAAGVILLGCAPGGTASNVVAYLARGDVALSVAMTSVSTLLAPLLTPLLTWWLVGSYLPVAAGDMAYSIVQIVLVPVLAGLLLRTLFPRLVEAALPALPWVSVAAIALVVMVIVARSAEAIAAAGLVILAAVVLHNAAGLAAGYLVGRACRLPVASRRTVALEVGMQNSGLAAGLAGQYFAPEAALPGAVFSVWHNVTGSIMAAVWRRRAVPAARLAADEPADERLPAP